MLDIGMVIYVALFVIALWRWKFKYAYVMELPFLNYVSFLYMLMAGVLVYVTISLYMAMSRELAVTTYPEVAGFWSATGLHTMALIAPAAVLITMALNWYHTTRHVSEILSRSAETKHERVVQILAIPTVYGVMAMASMLPVLELVMGRISSTTLAASWHDMLPATPLMGGSGIDLRAAPAAPWEAAKHWAIWRSATCFYVGDLFQAWGIYQFGKLVLAELDQTMIVSKTGQADEESPLSKLEQDVVESYKAVASLTWIGTSMFIMLCVAQSSLSLWPYVGGDRDRQETIMLALKVGGNVTSAAAIYNLLVIAQTFSRRLSSWLPMPKVLGLSFLLWMSFLQRGFLSWGHELTHMMPLISLVPFLGLSGVQLQFFYPCAVAFECLLASLFHFYAWGAHEEWYIEEGTEKEHLVPKVPEERYTEQGTEKKHLVPKVPEERYTEQGTEKKHMVPKIPEERYTGKGTEEDPLVPMVAANDPKVPSQTLVEA